MIRQIFVGSSTEALEKAKQICAVLSGIQETKCVLWTELFQPGSLTFEVLEQMLVQCCAAVFVATPDDRSVIRGKEIRTPRSNVLLEFGLVAGRLGRHSIAVCQYGDAVLPSDLTGLTVVNMGEDENVSDQAREQIRIWGTRLIATMDTFPRTEIVHGYTGRWDFKLSLDKWRDLPVTPPSFVQINGTLDVFISGNGQEGRGMAHGRLFFRLMPVSDSEADVYQGEYRTAHEISSAVCYQDGSLEITTQAFALQKMNSSGNPPVQLFGTYTLPEPWSSKWILYPSAEPRTFEGDIQTEGGGISKGTARVTRIGSLS